MSDTTLRLDLPKLKLKAFTGQYLNNYRVKERLNFRLMFGPPFTSGIPHLGSLYVQILKDMVCRMFKNIGYKVDLIPGFDCHGLPTERLVRKYFPYVKEDSLEFLTLCVVTSRYNSILQIYWYNKFDVNASWERPYLTMDNPYISHVNSCLRKLKGSLIKSWKEIDWCPIHCEPCAFSEIITCEHKLPKIWLTFETNVNLKLIVYTTTPWSLKGNNGFALNSNVSYFSVKGKVASEWYWRSMGIDLSKQDRINQDFLANVKVWNDNTWVEVHFCDWVSEEGTGIVHVSGFYNKNDWSLLGSGKSIDLHTGRSFSILRENDKVIGELETQGRLVRLFWENKLVKCNERTGEPLINLMSKQVFLTSNTRSIAKALTWIREIDWGSKSGERYVRQMLTHQKNWCLSRNRKFNTPLCLKPQVKFNVVNRYRWLGKKLPGLDVWFDSSCSFSYLYSSPVDVVLEGVDQYRGYFLQSLRLHSMILDYKPYRKVLTTGFIVRTDGNKLSKSKANSDSIDNLAFKYGTDSLRLWCAQHPFAKNVKLSNESLEFSYKKTSKLRNLIRYLLNYYQHHSNETTDHPLDLWLLTQVSVNFVDNVRYTYAYMPQLSLKQLLNLIEQISTIYLCRCKNRLYCEVNTKRKREIIFTLKRVTEYLMFLMRTFTPKLYDEAMSTVQVNQDLDLRYSKEYDSSSNNEPGEWVNHALNHLHNFRKLHQETQEISTLKEFELTMFLQDTWPKRYVTFLEEASLFQVEFYPGSKVATFNSEILGTISKLTWLQVAKESVCKVCKLIQVNQPKTTCDSCDSLR